MRAYGELLANRDARWPVITSTVSRITPGMIVLALVLLVRDGGYSYSAAGLISAAHQVGVGLASPVQGRLADRFGQRAVLVPDAVAYLTGTVALAGLVGRGASVPLLVAVAVAAGLFFPPTTACSRVVLSGLFPSGRLRQTAFAVSSIAVEIGFIVGPLVAVTIQQAVGARWSVVAAGLVAAVGALGYAATAAVGAVPRREVARARGGALGSPGVRVMVVALGFVAIAFGVLDIVVPAVAELAGNRAAAGWLIASIAAGSLIGGLVYGAGVWPGTAAQRLQVLAGIFTLGFLVIPLSVGSLPTFALGLFVGGLFLGPTTIAAFQLIDDLALPGTQTEAQSWTQSFVVAGVAVGASMAGFVVDAGGPRQAFVAGAVCVGVGVLVVILRRDRLSQPMRGSDVPLVAPPAVDPLAPRGR